MRIGLDFGTTTTLVAVQQPGTSAYAVPLGRATAWVPSLIGIDEHGALRFGDEAAGTPFPYRSVKKAITDRLTTVELRGADGTTVDIRRDDAISGLLSHIADLAEAAGVPVRDHPVQLGCPAIWDGQQRVALTDAAKGAGISAAVTDVLDEPIAAALAWKERSRARADRALVFDYGGGTLDIAVVSLESRDGISELTALASRGVGRAGDALDAAIASDLRCDLLRNGCDLDRLPNPRLAAARLLDAATELKILLSQPGSNQLSTSLGPGFASIPPVTYSVSHLEAAFTQQLDEALEYTRAALCEAAVRVGRFTSVTALRQASLSMLAEAVGIGTVLLAGGMSRIPVVERAIREALPHVKRIESLDPDRGLADVQASVGIGLAARREHFDSLNLSRPAVDLVLEYETRDGRVARDTLYPAFTALYTASQVLGTDDPRSLGYRCAYDTSGVERETTGRLVARGLDGRSYPFRVDRDETDYIEIHLSRLRGLRLGLYVDGRMQIDDGTRRSRAFRIKRWPMLDREMRRVVDMESVPDPFGGGKPNGIYDHWRE